MSNGRRFGMMAVGVFTAIGVIAGGVAVFLLLKPSTGTGSSPIKVGGGAISFQSDSSSDQWSSDGSGGFCLNSYVPKKIVVHAAGEDDNSNNNAPIGSGQTWTVIFHGRDSSKPNGVSDRGIQATGGDPNDSCKGSVHLTPYDKSGNKQSQFYPDDPRQTVSGLSIVRFQDASGALCTGPNYPSPTSPPPTQGDEDLCEQLSQVEVTVNGAPASWSPVGCLDIRCVVHLKQ